MKTYMRIFGIILLCLLASCRQAPPVPIEQHPRDGSVLYWENSRLVKPILRHTGSNITHAAIILDGWVYEAVPPAVHKMPLSEYYDSMEAKAKKPALEKRGFNWFIMEPRIAFTVKQLRAMKYHAESQLGRPYQLKGWWKGHEVKGIFCSQFVGDTVERSGLIASGHVHESPGSLHKKLLPYYKERTND